MATTQLELYNVALDHLGQRRIGSLAENSDSRRTLDAHWPQVVNYCLEQGLWNFAMRSVAMTSAPSIAPAFGYENGFEKPGDWIRTLQFSGEETFRVPLQDLADEAGHWFANVDPLFIRYVSNDPGYGRNLSLWPMTFADYVAVRLAGQTCLKITASDTRLAGLSGMEKRYRIDARSKDAMNEPARQMPQGTWARSRAAWR